MWNVVSGTVIEWNVLSCNVVSGIFQARHARPLRPATRSRPERVARRAPHVMARSLLFFRRATRARPESGASPPSDAPAHQTSGAVVAFPVGVWAGVTAAHTTPKP